MGQVMKRESGILQSTAGDWRHANHRYTAAASPVTWDALSTSLLLELKNVCFLCFCFVFEKGIKPRVFHKMGKSLTQNYIPSLSSWDRVLLSCWACLNSWASGVAGLLPVSPQPYRMHPVHVLLTQRQSWEASSGIPSFCHYWWVLVFFPHSQKFYL